MPVVIAGAGPAGLEAALALQRLAGHLVAITIVAPEPRFTYRPLAVIEPFGLGHAPTVDLADLAAEQGWAYIRDAIVAVDAEHGRARLRAGAPLPYAALLLAVGAEPAEAVPGALTFRGPRDGERLASALDSLPRDRTARVAFAVAPATAWTLPAYELALLTARWAREHGLDLEPWVVTHEPAPLLDVFGRDAADAVIARGRAPVERRGGRRRRGRPPVGDDGGRDAGGPGRRAGTTGRPADPRRAG